jgi:hypothetical protein
MLAQITSSERKSKRRKVFVNGFTVCLVIVTIDIDQQSSFRSTFRQATTGVT